MVKDKLHSRTNELILFCAISPVEINLFPCKTAINLWLYILLLILCTDLTRIFTFAKRHSTFLTFLSDICLGWVFRVVFLFFISWLDRRFIENKFHTKKKRTFQNEYTRTFLSIKLFTLYI